MFFIKHHKNWGIITAGACAGGINGLLGAGGGMVLVPLLSFLTDWDDRKIFSSSVAIILPICIVSLTATAVSGTVAWTASLPYLAGSAAGGLLSGLLSKKIPVKWLHRGLGILMIWGGWRYLC